MAKYGVTFDNKASNITMKLEGKFTPVEGMNFMKDFMKMSNKVKTDDTYLILESGLLHMYPYQAIEKLKPFFKMYRDTGYKLVRVKLFKPQKEFGLQIKRLAEYIGLKLEILYI